MGNDLDLTIVGGVVVDGTGAPGRRADVGIREGRIAVIGEIKNGAKATIDAGGQIVAPGFVDIHTHYDAQAFWDPTLGPSSGFGVTSVIGGNCGFSIAPLSGRKEDAEYLMRMLARVEGMPLESLQAGVPWDWTTFADFLSRHDDRLAINCGFMVGHSAIRRTVMGARAVGEKATVAELDAMKKLLSESIAAGGLGFSSTINNSHNDAEGNPVPSRHAAFEELIALAGVLKDHEGTSLEFLPRIGGKFGEDMLDLLTDLSKAANRPLNWNVLAPDSRLPEVYASQLGASDYAKARGARVLPLVSAQVNSTWVNFISGFILDMYPGWDELFRLPHVQKMAALSDPARRRRLDADARSEAAGTRALTSNWADWTFASTAAPQNRRFDGRRIGEVATELGKTPFDTMIDVVLADELKTSLQMPKRGADEATWKMRADAWKDERTIVGASDAGAHLDMIDTFTTSAKLLSVGVREKNLLSLEEAVRQLSSVPARLVGLRERGELRVGNHADIVVFDAKTVGCGPVHMRHDLPAGAGRLFAEPVGVKHVFCNGVEIARNGAMLEARPGRVLRSGRDTYTVALGA